ncbi:hypothetical protein N7532_003029 [Penicillium argentinense]|uniref:N-acetyl-D-glucosamine kinase n=1 Tax=Penicillium argentinense TaxID=1131581 RepID=A0A9W9FM87_9EURO|nr:uncharacterized protein N7532_003029 [Penicillium argentinense]KAJ5102500.1 hypothetical protein N7532_003029 [Penicillium argentinense]
MDLGSLANLQTEGVNPRTVTIDRMSTLEMCSVINADDHCVAESVAPCLPVIAGAIDGLAQRVRRGGRVIYVGAGTSGRLGILDASEIPPTFAASREQFVGLIAGGDAAIRQAQEGAEDNEQAGGDEMKHLNLDPKLDSIIGIASSGRTPYVMGCLAFGKSLGCLTIGVVCTEPSVMGLSGNVDYLIAPLPGPEVVTGSTRLKAGTATKLVLNMLSTGTMIRTGKTYGNMMVDLQASNLKLKQRSKNILKRLSTVCAALSDSEMDTLLVKCDRSVKLAILVAETGKSVEDCKKHLQSAGGILSKALDGVAQPARPVVNKLTKKLVLCVDGGGTKCAAVVCDASGNTSHGYSGPSNLYVDVLSGNVEWPGLIQSVRTDGISNVDGVVANLINATKSALNEHLHGEELTESVWRQCLQTSFRSVWIGLAGLDRAGLQAELAPKLSEMFGLDHTTTDFRLTSDVDLLPGTASQQEEHPPVVVLIAGTGSVAMRYTWNQSQGYVRVARAGGWGHLLGDEGGGYSIGRESIKHTLTVLEERTLGLRDQDLGELELAVVKQLDCPVTEDGSIDLLTDILSRQHTSHIKARIAGVAETVLKLAVKDHAAKAIVTDQITCFLNKTLDRLNDRKCRTFTPAEESELVLAGGLMKNEEYQALLRQQLGQRGLRFREVRVVEDVAEAAATCLALN